MPRRRFPRRRSLLPLIGVGVLGVLVGSFILPVSPETVEGSDPSTDEERFDPAVSRTGNRVEYAAGQILVKFEEGTPEGVENAVLAGAGADPEVQIGKIDVTSANVSPTQGGQALAALKASPHVEYAERDVVMEKFDTIPNDDLWSTQWGLANIRAPKAWDSARGASTLVIAVLDTGVNVNHPDLKTAFVTGYDMLANDTDPSDEHGHGTAAAGVLAARTNNVEGVAGTCWNCMLMPVQVLDASGRGTTSTIAAGIVWAVDHGARVISMSLGGVGTTQTLTDAVEYATGKGAIIVAAAGNNGTTTPFYPAAYPEVLSVAATTSSNALYSWSNRGAWVKVAAPGCNKAPGLTTGYVDFCGTSSATPMVAGIAGLALSAKPEATRSDVLNAIQRAAAPLADVQYGRVNADATLAQLGIERITKVTFKGRLSSTRLYRTYSRSVGAGRVSISLSFTRPRTLTLSIWDARRTLVARISSGTPLRVKRTLRAGSYTFAVRTAKNRASYALSLTYPTP